jgi:putative membrane protein
MNFIMRILITGIVAFGLSYILPGVHILDNKFTTALILAVVLALLDTFVKPLLILLTFPITILTLGLFLFVINALIIYFADRVIPNFKVDGFWWALIFSLLLSFITSLINKTEKKTQA